MKVLEAVVNVVFAKKC